MVAKVIFLGLVLLATTGYFVAHCEDLETTSDLIADGPRKLLKKRKVHAGSHIQKRAQPNTYDRSGGFNQEEATLLLEQHNKYREIQNASNMLIMEWNSDLQKSAQNYADKCNSKHSPDSDRKQIGGFRKVGENIKLANYKISVTQIVDKWYSEIQYYRYDRNTTRCMTGRTCGHYKQVVWHNSYALGCGIKLCDRVQHAGDKFKNSYVAVCHYGPSGNQRFALPYRKGKPCSLCDKKITPFCIRKMCSSGSKVKQVNVTGSGSGSGSGSPSGSGPSTPQLRIIIIMLTSLATLKVLSKAAF
ncbi:peptidase inhibitor 16 [Elysia marginata]|uniref:Peptidase inhibitor 16 n=1 Tax=Elysia marginata TaxID=1093978 RepID=A0AAV4J957_9GAST|nr:peptidase inhibitor 16 [Elysia marginata]